MQNKLKENIKFIIDFIKDIPMFIWICIMCGRDSYEIKRQLTKYEQDIMLHGKNKSYYLKSGIVVLVILLILFYIFL